MAQTLTPTHVPTILARDCLGPKRVYQNTVLEAAHGGETVWAGRADCAADRTDCAAAGFSVATCHRCCACATTAPAATIVIDNFTQPSAPNPAQFFQVPAGNNPFLQFNQVVSGVIGGQRDTLVQAVGNAVADAAIGNLGHDSSSGLDALNLVASGLAPTVTSLMYSGVHAPPGGGAAQSLVNAHLLGAGLGVDLTDGGTNDRFIANFLASDASPTAGLEMAITITSPGGKSSTATVVLPNSAVAFNYTIPFNTLVGTATPTQVDSIEVVFNGTHLTTNVDYKYQTLAVVPEPAAGFLMAMASGAFGLAARFSRQRRRS